MPKNYIKTQKRASLDAPKVIYLVCIRLID